MTLFKYWVLLILAAVVLGFLPNMVPNADPAQARQIVFSFIILVYIPIIAFFRMRYIGMTLKEYFLEFIPFNGVSRRFKRTPKK